MFILELLKLSNFNKLSEFESNNYTFISPIQLPFVMTRGNTYGSTDSSPGDHQFSIGLWPVFLYIDTEVAPSPQKEFYINNKGFTLLLTIILENGI